MRKLICFDLDSTLIDGETLNFLAKGVGREKEIEELTFQAMSGGLPFIEALKKRLALLKGMPFSQVEEIAAKLPLMPGAEELVAKLKKEGFVTGIISGGFEPIAARVAQRLKMDFFYANRLEVKEGSLTGGFELKVGGNKGRLLKKAKEIFRAELTVAVGDGITDLPMLEAADLGIAFCAKPRVNEKINARIREKNLLAVLELIP